VKSTIDQIRQRFDNDVERFSNLETGQSATIDAPLVLDLITQTAAATNPRATAMLDVGCGAGNYTLKMLGRLPGLNITLVDLSQPMLDRAVARVSKMNVGTIIIHQADIRELDLGEEHFDIITAAAVLHHLRSDAEWEAIFTKFYATLKPGGSVWISDLIEHTTTAVQTVMWNRYGDYLTEFKDEAYRDQVFTYIEQEDTPRSLLFQIDMLRKVGFEQLEILHKNSCFAAFGAVKSA
jgi:tRNA (cmo5U34)-methyltransferase